jgi:membrane-associated protein
MFAGVFLGEIPYVRDHFEVAVMVLVVISVLPIVFEFVMHKKRAKKKKADAEYLASQPYKDQAEGE